MEKEPNLDQLGKSQTIIEQNIEQLKQLFPQIFHEDNKIDFISLKEILGDKIEDKKEFYGLSWAGKSEARRELAKNTTATLTPDRDKSVDFDTTQNIFIEGENLEVLRCLQKSYFGKIKMIYIDPPYNTGSDSFVYPDNYSETRQEYEKRAGITDENGYINKVDLWKQNSKENGQYHSVWLSMMYSRLCYSHSLLSKDGVIFISIDDNEQANLKLLCDSVFGESNFVADIIWNSTKSVTNTALISVSHTHTLVYFKEMEYYTKNRNKFRLPENGEGFSNPDNDNRGDWKADPFQVGGWRPNQQYDIINPKTGVIYKPNPNCSWKNDNNKFQELIKDNRIVFGVSGEAGPQRKRFIWEAEERGMVAKTIWEDVETTTNGTQLLKKIFDEHTIFDNPKPISLIKRMLQLGTNEDSIILDFFAGSGTTGQAVMELNKDGGNRTFICVQMPEKTNEESEAYKQGYEKISDICAERLRRAGRKIKEEFEKELKDRKEELFEENYNKEIDTGFRYYYLSSSHFKIWQEDIEKENLGKQLDAFVDSKRDESSEEGMLYELILKLGFQITTCIEKKEEEFYYLKDWNCCIALNNFEQKTIDAIFSLSPKEVITLDKFFDGDDALLSNIRLGFKDMGIILTII